MPIWSRTKGQSQPQNDENGKDTSSPESGGERLPKSSANGTSQKTSNMDRHSHKKTKGGNPDNRSSYVEKPKLVFHCQQAHGSPTGLISGFTSIKDLYQKIADCYDFPASEILFCTLNTHKVDMEHLLAGQIGLDDFIFAHRKGQTKEVEINKSEDALGLTITDNGNGYCFIKRIKEGSVMDKIEYINVGDHIEKINVHNLVGKKHFEVAKLLKEIEKGSNFTMRLVEPLRAGFANIGPRSNSGPPKKAGYGSGRETLRLRATGPATVEEAPDDIIQSAVTKINNQLESFMGINDIDLAMQIWEKGQDKKNPIDFTDAVETSDLAMFGFTEDFIFDLWGVISDAKAGRLQAR